MPLQNNYIRFVFLSDVVKWLNKWKTLLQKHEKLTPQTFTSFRHSCIVLEKIVNHITQHCGFTYVLSSFLQSDPIEHHFGIYRMMSGAQYNVTFCRVLQSERQIKISAILKLFFISSSKVLTILSKVLLILLA